MKHLKLLFLLVTFYSCSKENNRVGGTDSEISFDINGTHSAFIGDQTINNVGVGVFAVKQTGTPSAIPTYYSFAGFKDNGNLIQIIIPTGTDTLKPIVYHVTTGLNMKSDNFVYMLSGSDFMDIKITNYQKGVVDATFSGKITKVISISPNSTQSVTLTNGLIKNVLVNY